MSNVINLRPKHRGFNISAPGANTDAITDVNWGSRRVCRLTIQCATSTVVNLMVTRSSTEKALAMNDNAALTAAALYVFDIPGLDSGDLVNVQVETDSVIDILALDEVF